MGSATSSDPGARGGLRAAIERALPKGRYGDQLTILSGTGQNAGTVSHWMGDVATRARPAR